MKHIGNELNRIIEEKRLVKKDVAATVGMTAVNFSQVLRKASIDCGLLERICNAIKIHPAHFFDYDKPFLRDTDGADASATGGNASESPLERENELLKKMLEEKERTIQILLGEKK